ncbi:hypothetical protein DXA95_12425 [Odoribacter sp. OF09-27XD]|jgi:hypothetical protein|nr:hypothetical protein [Odoribacter sp. OF09-27XD]RHV92604.1 hypothetical protein DXA95_12425 [Odoribacter sp. OF09-27XD]
MIKPNDLRIGNYVIHYPYSDNDSDSRYIKINNINEHGVNRTSIKDDGYSIIRYDRISPIPLTEELLLKCGFDWGGGEFDFILSNVDMPVSVFRIKDGYCFLLGNGVEGVFSTDKIEYLHQLQNVIFDLYGKELEVKL